MNVFVIKYDAIRLNVQFAIRNSSGKCVGIDDSEKLKEYENVSGIFTLEGKGAEVFEFLSENFGNQSEVGIEIETSPVGFDARKNDFERFSKAVQRFNKDGGLKLNLKINQTVQEAVPTTRTQQPTIDTVGEDHVTPIPNEESAEPIPAMLDPIPEKQIPSKLSTTLKRKIAVVGKIKSGKTNLITGMIDFLGSSYELSSRSRCYTDKKNNVEWYEVDGIDLGRASVDQAQAALDRLIADGVSTVLYCLHSMIGKIEDPERDLIVDIRRSYPNVQVFIVITACVDEEKSNTLAHIASTATKHTQVFPVLAKEMPIKAGYLEPWGLGELATILFGELST